MSAQTHLIPPRPRDPKPRAPRRVLGQIADAGDRYRAYRCVRCGAEWEYHLTPEQEEASHVRFERYGSMTCEVRDPCPTCSPGVVGMWGPAAPERP